MNKLNIIIAGSRDITTKRIYIDVLDQYKIVPINISYILNKIKYYLQNYKEDNITILSGNARGVDKIGEIYANDHNIQCNIYPADWDTHGKSAGYKRNITMADNANALLAFWNYQSKGTKHMINIAKQKGLTVKIVKISN